MHAWLYVYSGGVQYEIIYSGQLGTNSAISYFARREVCLPSLMRFVYYDLIQHVSDLTAFSCNGCVKYVVM